MDKLIAAVWFSNQKRREKYLAWQDVWWHSANKTFGSETQLLCREHEYPDMTGPCPVFVRGKKTIGPGKTHGYREKIRLWNEIVQTTPVGIPILLTDIDVAFYDDPFPAVFDELESWDIGICGFATGTIYVSGSRASHAFIQRWYEATEEMAQNEELYKKYELRYKGLDQGSFQLLLERGKHPGKVLQLPFRFHSTYQNAETPCYIMHYHSLMAGVIFGTRKIEQLPVDVRPYATAWLDMLKEARAR